MAVTLRSCRHVNDHLKERGANVVRIFKDDEDGYIAWLASHPRGNVINANRGISPNYLILHTANCYTICQYWGKATKGGFTERNYVKICARSHEELRSWAKETGLPLPFTHCQKCNPV